MLPLEEKSYRTNTEGKVRVKRGGGDVPLPMCALSMNNAALSAPPSTRGRSSLSFGEESRRSRSSNAEASRWITLATVQNARPGRFDLL